MTADEQRDPLTSSVEIREGGLDHPEVVRLLDHHLRTARANTEEGCAHALDLSGLRHPAISFYSAWEGELLLGTGAIKRIADRHGEIKSMHTAEAARRRGIGRLMVRHLLNKARQDGLERVSLETGSWPFFEPAVALYRSMGFVECSPFGDYRPDPNSVFMTRLV